eukprot:CAMPEP_0171322778 /NCGR_PEP_ID=MMETSP0816-20121228/115170_1 /TAXON_ID=420281 /ORGANISM="Proboscia inermis, Strain CCAP1064/1" /LENGTH=196 /DNA_ID=CAMNT_0011821337 /DNA_START=108 /DNA_END=698 /DNA_ORIENTATION=+
MIDAAADQIGKRFLSDAQPPTFLPHEETTQQNQPTILPTTLCRMKRPHTARLVLENNWDATDTNETKAVLYHSLDNSREYHGVPLSPMEFEMDDAPALEALLISGTRTDNSDGSGDDWVEVQDLVHTGSIDDKVELVNCLVGEGLLLVCQPEELEEQRLMEQMKQEEKEEDEVDDDEQMKQKEEEEDEVDDELCGF